MKTRTPSTYTFNACFGDRVYGTDIADGTPVRKCKGPGVGRVSKPFTYVEDATTGRFLGMVLCSSLTLKKASAKR